MPPGEENKEGENTGGENTGEKGAQQPSTSSTNASSPASSESTQPVFKEPEILQEPEVVQAVVNPKTPQKEGPTPFSFTNPKAMHQQMAEKTKGDVATATTSPVVEKKLTLAELDAEIARDEKDDKQYTIDDYRDTAEMFVEGWEALLTFASRMISKDYTNSAYEFSVPKKERLIHQATKVSRKRNWVMPIEYMFLGTLLPASGAILLKASDKRKEYMKKVETESPAQTEELTKGGPNASFPKRRGPGRPSK